MLMLGNFAQLVEILQRNTNTNDQKCLLNFASIVIIEGWFEDFLQKGSKYMYRLTCLVLKQRNLAIFQGRKWSCAHHARVCAIRRGDVILCVEDDPICPHRLLWRGFRDWGLVLCDFDNIVVESEIFPQTWDCIKK